MSYHPASDGACERMNRTIIAELAKRINQFGTEWASQLKWVEFAYNSTPQGATNLSPYVLWFGREPRTPFEAQMPLVNIADDQAVLPNDTPLQDQELDFIGLDKDLRMDRNHNDTLSPDAWIPTFVYEETELEPAPGQSGSDSIDTSAGGVHFPNQLNIGEVPD